MASQAPYRQELIVPQEMRASEVTVPGVELYHYITDDQLTELAAMRAEPVMEIALGAIGAFVGSIIPALEALSHFNDPTEPMGWIGLVTVGVAVVSFCLASFAGLLWHSRHKRHADLAKTIRSRSKVAVKVCNDNTETGS